MRILYITSQFPKLSESFVQAEIQHMSHLGVAVGVASWRRKSDAILAESQPDWECDRVRPSQPSVRGATTCLDSARALGCSTSPREFATGVARSASLIRGASAWKPDVIHAHFASLSAYVGLILGHVLQVPVTCMPHARDYKVAVTPQALNARLTRCAWVFAISHQALTEVLTLCGNTDGLPARTEVVRASWAALEKPKRGIARPKTGGEFNIVTVARLVRKKGIDTAIRAIAELVRRGHSIIYTVVGDGPELSHLQRLAATLGVSDRVRFVGALPPDLVGRVTAGSDMVLLLCRRAADGDTDGIPVSLIEAGELGLPVVSTNVGGIAELIEHRKSGLLCPSEDPVQASRLIAELIEQPNLGPTLGRNLRDHVVTEFDPGRQARRLRARWEGLISPGPHVA